MTSLRARDVVQSASDLCYGCSRAILTRAKRAPKSENGSSEDRDVDYRLKKKIADLVKLPNQLQFFFASRQFQVGENTVS